MTIKRCALGLALLFCSTASVSDRRPISVEECIRTRRLVNADLALSPDGTNVAYVIKSPNLSTNKNDYELFVRDVNQTSRRENGRLLLQSGHLSNVTWLGDGKAIAILSQEGKNNTISLVDVASRRISTIERSLRKITSYSINSTGDVVAYVTGVWDRDAQEYATRSLRGFAIAPGRSVVAPENMGDWLPQSKITLIIKNNKNRAVVTKPVSILGPGGRPSDVFKGQVSNLSLSPDGTYLAFYYVPEALPETWKSNPLVKLQLSQGVTPTALGLLNIKTGEVRLGFDSPVIGFGPVIWAGDSSGYVIHTLSPVGSAWEARDRADGFREGWQYAAYMHLFAVDVKSKSISRIWAKYPPPLRGRLVWNRSGEILVLPHQGGTVRMRQKGKEWEEVGRIDPFPPVTGDVPVATNGEVVVGVNENYTTPPDLFLQRRGDDQKVILTDWNPQFRSVTLGTIEKVEWMNKYGTNCTGLLIKPVGYTPGVRYPLVIMNVPREGFFVTDLPYTTAFPPQSLANAGFAVLMASHYFGQDHVPKGYPGEIGQVYNWIAMVESAIDLLADRGIVDKKNVGIMGFSRTSWFTDVLLTHSEIAFKAASSADSGLGNYSEYWLYNDRMFITAGETELGGPPYGGFFKTWLQYSPAFNAQKVGCPLLMEYIGANGRLKYGPTHAYEFFVALYRQGKPVELYFYPNGDHPLDTPWERAASLQRNVDWFRFWMQGYEGTAPVYDPEQYLRWRKLREQQRWNEMNQAQGKDPVEEYLRRPPKNVFLGDTP